MASADAQFRSEEIRKISCPFCASNLLLPAEKSLGDGVVQAHLRSSNECPYLPIVCCLCEKQNRETVRFATDQIFDIHCAKVHADEQVIEVGIMEMLLLKKNCGNEFIGARQSLLHRLASAGCWNIVSK